VNYHSKSITFYSKDHPKVCIDVDMDTRLTPKVKLALIAEHCPDAYEMNVYTSWNNTGDIMRNSFRSGMNFIEYKIVNGKWSETNRGTYTNR